MKLPESDIKVMWKPAIISAALAFLYANVLIKLGFDWWDNENYSHGLIVPFVIGYIIWLNFDDLRASERRAQTAVGFTLVLLSIAMLLAGTLGAELFTQRISLVLILAGITIYFFGSRILAKLIVPFVLLLLAIPIPEIIFNKIAFPLQIWASKVSALGIRLFGIPSERKGNVIELIPLGETKLVGLEVVEACSGIRSLMTLATLALVLAYFTRERRENISRGLSEWLSDPELWRTLILMFSAIPIALVTNGVRVMVTGILTYYYGQHVAEGRWHDLAGWLVFAVAFVMMALLNAFLKNIFRGYRSKGDMSSIESAFFNPALPITSQKLVVLFIVIVLGGVLINWFQQRGEIIMDRKPLVELPYRIGNTFRNGADAKFGAPIESVLRATDYIMREYVAVKGLKEYAAGVEGVIPEITRFNLYVGYYASQRSGATYHSPQHCLPGSGWEMKDGQLVEINTPAGESFTANMYTVQNGGHREIMIYWYEGRGRRTASEYWDKIYTVWDSVTLRRSDGAMVRIMTPVINGDNALAIEQAKGLSANVADDLGPYVPK